MNYYHSVSTTEDPESAADDYADDPQDCEDCDYARSRFSEAFCARHDIERRHSRTLLGDLAGVLSMTGISGGARWLRSWF